MGNSKLEPEKKWSRKKMLVEFAEESKERWKLMEMPTHLLENNQKLYIKGAQGTDAVLCSDSHTYTIRNALTSNSLLITTTSHDNLLYSTVKTAHAQLQLTPCIPKTDHINHLLAASLYKGPAQEASLDHVNKNKMPKIENYLAKTVHL